MAQYQLFISLRKGKRETPFNECLALSNNDEIHLEFPALINAFWKLYNLDSIPNFTGALKYFYSQISDELIEHFEANKRNLQEESLALDETQAIVGALLAAAGEEYLFWGSEKMIDPSSMAKESLEPLNTSNKMLGLYSELVAFVHALTLWLSQNKSKNSSLDRYSNSWPKDIESVPVYLIKLIPELTAIYALQQDNLSETERLSFVQFRLLHAVRNFRSKMLHTDTVAKKNNRKLLRSHAGQDDSSEYLTKNHTSKLYESTQGILPLLWAEILFCIDNDLCLRQCRYCNKWFQVKKNEKYCCDKCREIAKKNQDDQRYLNKKGGKWNAQKERK